MSQQRLTDWSLQDWKRGRTAEQLDMPPKPKASRQATKRPGQNLLSLLLPRSRLEWKIMAAISAVRFGLVPAATMLVVQLAATLGVLPPDPVCCLVLLIQVSAPFLHISDSGESELA